MTVDIYQVYLPTVEESTTNKIKSSADAEITRHATVQAVGCHRRAKLHIFYTPTQSIIKIYFLSNRNITVYTVYTVYASAH